jgi:hypothetical protein
VVTKTKIRGTVLSYMTNLMWEGTET